MLIRNKKTGVEHPCTPEMWESLKNRNLSSKYVIVNAGKDKPAAPPEDTNAANYNKLVKDATKLFKAEKYEEAQKLYLQATAIKKTDLVTEKLNEIEALLNITE